MRLYVDTNVFLDYLWTDRKHHKEAADFFIKVIEEKHVTIISTWTTKELHKYVKPEEYTMLFKFLGKYLEPITYTEEDIQEAKKISPDHFQDALHGLLAIKAKSDWIVTRDASGFRCVRELIKTKLPEQVFL